jgi:hypothetical protein
LSYRNLEAQWYRTWPDKLVTTPYGFGRHWADTALGFIRGHDAVNAFLIRYEDLDKPSDIDRLSKYLGRPVSRSSALSKRDIVELRPPRTTLPWLDRLILDLATGKAQRAVGYKPTSLPKQ